MERYFDTHAHYDDRAFDEDRDTLLASMPGSGVSLVLNAGVDRASCLTGLELAKSFPFVYAAVGWHPHEARLFEEEGGPELIREWAKNPRVRALGEIGLDFHYDHSPRGVQRAVFRRQLELARELGLPVVIHDREAHGECMEIIGDFPGLRGEFHCYSGSAEMAKTLLARGWYLGFTGAVTYKNARKALEVIEITPMDRILLETDCPYLSPVPHRGRRNDSRLLPLVADVIAGVKGRSREEVAAAAYENGKRFFGIEN